MTAKNITPFGGKRHYKATEWRKRIAVRCKSTGRKISPLVYSWHCKATEWRKIIAVRCKSTEKGNVLYDIRKQSVHVDFL